MRSDTTMSFLAGSVLLAIAQPAVAQDAPVQGDTVSHTGRFSAGVTAGTLGVGPELGFRANRTIGVRANATFLSISHGFDSDDVRYHGKVNLKSGGVALDLYPFGGGFRLSAGARINGNNGRLTATPTSTTTIGDTAYTPAQIGTINGRAEVKTFAPQLSLGYGGGLHHGLSFNIEAGALFQGAVQIRRFTASGLLASNASFLAELEKERVNIQKDVDDYKVYPILQLGLKYRF